MNGGRKEGKEARRKAFRQVGGKGHGGRGGRGWKGVSEVGMKPL